LAVVPSGRAGGNARDPEGSADVTLLGKTVGTESSEYKLLKTQGLIGCPSREPTGLEVLPRIVTPFGAWEVPRVPTRPPARDDRLIQPRSFVRSLSSFIFHLSSFIFHLSEGTLFPLALLTIRERSFIHARSL
jgi:hypothetical protein